MRSAHIISIITILFLFEGCGLWGRSSDHFNMITQHRMYFLTPDSNSESFLGMFTTLLVDSTSRLKETFSIIRIDTNEHIQTLAIMYSYSSPASSMIRNWEPSVTILNDSCLIYGTWQDSSINFLNFNSGFRNELLRGYWISCFSHDLKYISVCSFEHQNWISEKRIYHLENNHLTLSGSLFDPGYTQRFSRNKFLLCELEQTFVINPDFTLFDSSTIGHSPIGEYSFSFLDNPMPGFRENDIVFRHGLFYRTKKIWNYSLLTRKWDVLFDTLNMTGVFPLPIQDIYLIRGLNDDEVKEYYDEQHKINAETGRDYTPGPTGYWMIGNSKAKKFIKLGYEGFSPTISSSGRHILFYKQDGDGYQMKVITVKELIDGM